jgi:hypothetical protein
LINDYRPTPKKEALYHSHGGIGLLFFGRTKKGIFDMTTVNFAARKPGLSL